MRAVITSFTRAHELNTFDRMSKATYVIYGWWMCGGAGKMNDPDRSSCFHRCHYTNCLGISSYWPTSLIFFSFQLLLLLFFFFRLRYLLFFFLLVFSRFSLNFFFFFYFPTRVALLFLNLYREIERRNKWRNWRMTAGNFKLLFSFVFFFFIFI